MSIRVAIVHDNLLDFGGSERVLLSLIKLYPDADLYTFFFNQDNAEIRSIFGKQHWRTSWFQSLPWLHKLQQYFSLLKPFAWWHFAHLNLKEYDLVITSSHSYNSKLVKTSRQTKHLCYLHTPPRFLYGYSHEFSDVTCFFLWRGFLRFLQRIDRQAAQNPDLIVVNSKETQRRVKKIYGRSSSVVYPPVSQLGATPTQTKKYFVAHSRLVKQKNIDLIVAVCTRYNFPLKVIGTGYLRKSLELVAGKNVQFLGFVPDQKLAKVYRSATALIYAAAQEDFGIVPVEAQSAGVPVLAYRSGGVTETVVDGETGYFFDELNVQSVMKAVRKLENHHFSSKKCMAQATQFDEAHFMHHMKAAIQKIPLKP